MPPRFYSQVPQSIGSYVMPKRLPHPQQHPIPYGNVPQSVGSFVPPPQQQHLNPQFAAQRVGQALQQQQQGPMVTSRGMPQDVSGEATGQPGAPGQLPQQVMKYMPDGTPVYYGTPEAEQLALQGLNRVRSGYGPKSAEFQHALQAAMGVLGTKYSRDALTTGLVTSSTGY